jgi:hypothetical protein
MNKKELIAPFLLIGLGLAFTIICFAVFLSNGKSKKWLARKMKVGALLLTLNSVASCEPFITTCYDMPAPPNSMWMNGMTESGIEILLDTSNVIYGSVEERQSEEFSFSIYSAENVKIQADTIIAVDGKFDNYSEEFKIELDTNILPGNYSLKLFDVSLERQAESTPRQEFNLIIKEN